MEKPVFSTKIRYLPPPRNGRELIIRKSTTYVYESQSYWDKEKKQPRAKRTLIGKLDETTGEIVPTDGRGLKRRTLKRDLQTDTTLSDDRIRELSGTLAEKDRLIEQLTAENQKLRKDKAHILKQLTEMITQYGQ